MIILSNCLTDTADEGTRKVAVNLVSRLKAQTDTMVVTYDSRWSHSDLHLSINKLMINRRLKKLLREKKQPLLYIPSPAKSLSLALRLWVLSRGAKAGISVLLTMPFAVNAFSKFLIKRSGAKILTLCETTRAFYSRVLGEQVPRLRAGVDTKRFQPASPEEKQALRQKYQIPRDKIVVLHIGHLKPGRNVQQLLKLDERFHGVLVVSTQTAQEQDGELRQKLTQQSNITLIDRYISNVEELYQLSDVYLFPVVQKESCIDSPLSALEAASCSIPVVTTDYGEMQDLLGNEGFYQIQSFETEALNTLLEKAAAEQKNPRQAVLPYDWQYGAQQLLMQ